MRPLPFVPRTAAFLAVAGALTLPSLFPAAARAQTVFFSNGSEAVFTVNQNGVVNAFANGFNSSSDLEFKAPGDLFVANQAVTRIDRFQVGIGTSPYVSIGPGLSSSIALAPNGDLFATNGTFGQIIRVTPDGTVTTFAQGFSNPAGLTFNSAGDLFVSNAAAGTISRVSPGGVVSPFATGITTPTRLAFNSGGDLFVVSGNSFANAAIQRITPGGSVSQFVGLPNTANDLAFAPNGDLFVASFNESAIRRITPQGVSTVFASILTDNRLSSVNSIAFAPSAVVAAPEPGTLALLALAALPMGAVAVRRRKKA